MKELNFTVRGVAPLLMRNGRLADNSDPFAMAVKEISGKRAKTKADYEEMARLEFLGGLYLNRENKPCIPGRVFEATVIGKGGAARKERMGKEAAVGVWVIDDAPLQYEGPVDPDKLWEDKRFVSQELVRVKTARVMRTRAIFCEWNANIRLEFDPEMVDEGDVRRWVEVAGKQVGLMDWRPRCGRFNVEWKD